MAQRLLPKHEGIPSLPRSDFFSSVALFWIYNLKCYSFPMNPITVSDILGLPIQDRIQLVEAIWDRIAEAPEAIELSDSQRAELDKRLATYHENPSLGSPWSEVRTRITRA